jgi:FkbM family methyltransferase
MRVSVIVPTRNSADSLAACLESIRRQTHDDVELLVVDNASTDATMDIARGFADLFLDQGPERSAQRNAGGHAASGQALVFIDSDMVLEPTVLAEVAAQIAGGADQVVIPERSFGDGFWSQVKAFERSLYVGDDSIEAARAFSQEAWEDVDGYDEGIVAGPEDWDIDQRVRGRGGRRTRTRAFIDHDEGHLTLGETARTKFYYGRSSAAYFTRHGAVAARQASPLRSAFVRRRGELVRRPGMAGSMLVMKVAELGAGAAGLLLAAAQAKVARTPEVEGAAGPTSKLDLSVVHPPGRGEQVRAIREAFRDWPRAVVLGTLWKVLPLPSRETVLHTRAGTRVACPLRPGAGSLYTALEVFAFGAYEQLGEVDDVQFVVDVGANLGAFVLWINERSPGVRGVAFEPDPVARSFLAKNLRANAINGVTARPDAVGGATGTATLHRSGHGDGISTLHPGSIEPGLLTNTVEVGIVGFDDLIASLDGQQIDVLKLDCEGAEHAIVHGSSDASWRDIRHVALEFHPVDGQTADALEATLAGRGFRTLARESFLHERGMLWMSR